MERDNDKNEIAGILRDHTCYSPQARAYVIHGGIEALIKWRDKFVPEWISVEDAMPDYNVGVLVFIPEEDNHITSGMWDISDKWVLLDEYRKPECAITHWMRMPDEPKINR